MTGQTETEPKPSTGKKPGANKARTDVATPEKRAVHKVTPAKPDNNKAETPYESQIFTIPEAAGQLQMSTYTVQDMLRKGELKGSKLRSRWRISGKQINDYLAANQTK